MTFIHEKLAEKLDALTERSTDMDIAEAVADWMLCGKLPPFSVSINHNGKASPCPIRVDRVGAKGCSVRLQNLVHGRTWILDALTRGYEISCGTMNGHETRSIARERSRIRHSREMAEYRAKRATGEADDDEIPF